MIKKSIIILLLLILCGCDQIDNKLDNNNIVSNSQSQMVNYSYDECIKFVSTVDSYLDYNTRNNLSFKNERNNIYRCVTYKLELKHKIVDVNFNDDYFIVNYEKNSDSLTFEALGKDFDKQEIELFFENGKHILTFYSDDSYDLFTIYLVTSYIPSAGKNFILSEDGSKQGNFGTAGPIRCEQLLSSYTDLIDVEALKLGDVLKVDYYSINIILAHTYPLEYSFPEKVIKSISSYKNSTCVELTIGDNHKLYDNEDNEYVFFSSERYILPEVVLTPIEDESLVERYYRFINSMAEKFDSLAIGSKVYAAIPVGMEDNYICGLYLEKPD